MANNYISLKVCGNPDANSGLQTLVLFNSPSFDIPDTVYSGFEQNPFFLSFVIEERQIVYKLYMNKVKSFGSSRAGTLIIGMSVPVNYKFQGGISPYLVLTELKNEYLAACMTCTDPLNGTYAFKSGANEMGHVLDAKAQQFPLVPSSGKVVRMRPTGPNGCLLLSQQKITELFKDVMYSEFEPYREIFVAEQSSNTANYKLLTDITIPRQRRIAIYEDGKPTGKTVTDLTEEITYTPPFDKRFYDCQPVRFTIEQVVKGEIPNITYNPANESIEIKSAGMVTPKNKKVQVIIQTDLGEIRPDVTKVNLTLNGRKVPLNHDMSFVLSGKDIEFLNNPEYFDFSWDSAKTQYDFTRCDIKGDVLIVRLRKIQNVAPSSGTSAKRTVLPPAISNSDTVVRMKFDARENIVEPNDLLKVSYYPKNNDREVTTTTVKFSSKGKTLEGSFFIPGSTNKDLTFSFTTKDAIYTSKKAYNPRNTKEIELSSRDFTPREKESKSPLKRILSKNGLIGLAAGLLLGLILGLIIGFVGSKWLSSGGETKTQSEQKTDIKEDPEKQEYNSVQENIVLDESTRRAKLLEYHNKLEDKNNVLSFKCIEDAYNDIEDIKNYKKYHDVDSGIVDNKPKLKVCAEIEEYYQVVQDIRNGNFDSIKTKIDNKVLNGKGKRYTQINKTHFDLLFQMTTGTIKNGNKEIRRNDWGNAKEHFFTNNNFRRYKNFNDVVYVWKPNAENNVQVGGSKGGGSNGGGSNGGGSNGGGSNGGGSNGGGSNGGGSKGGGSKGGGSAIDNGPITR